MPAENITALLEQVPGPDNQSLAAPADLEKLQRVIEAVVAGGQDTIAGLIAQLRDPTASDAADAKARYVLHIVAVRAGGSDDDEPRRAVAEALAAGLGGDAPVSVKQFLARQLQVCGHEEALAALGRQLTQDNDELADAAAQALTAIGTGAALQFRTALPHCSAPQRRIVLQQLGLLQDREAVPALQEALADEDHELRLTAAWALARIGAPAAAGALLQLADGEQGYARAQADKACLLLAERLRAAGEKPAAAKVYEHLRDNRQAPAEKYLHDVAERGLAALDQ